MKEKVLKLRKNGKSYSEISKSLNITKATISYHCKNNDLNDIGLSLKKSSEEYVKEAISIHNNKYDYSLVEYKNNRTKIKIICPNHGKFEQNPFNHLKNGCFYCNGGKFHLQDWINKSNEIHDYKYDYSLVEYKESMNKIKIICPNHGIFKQRVSHHLTTMGCSKCSNKHNYNNEEFIKKCMGINGNLYDYSLVEYKNAKSKVSIICKKHGEFKQTPSSHLSGKGCPVCKESKGEREIRHLLETNNIKYYNQHKFEDCLNERKLSFDFYLPDYNMCIEYDGEQHFKSVKHWGGEKTFQKVKKRDGIKNEYCKENDIILLRIRFDEGVKESIHQSVLGPKFN